MLGLNNYISPEIPIVWQDIITNRAIAILCFAAFCSFIPSLKIYKTICERLNAPESTGKTNGIKFATGIAVYTLSIMSLSTSTFNAFIYFTF
jgi:hypothetical protein